MKTYDNLFEDMLSDEVMDLALKGASHGKKNRSYVKRIFANWEYHKGKLRELLKSGEYRFKPYSISTINEGSDRKVRTITKPKFIYDQIVHHMIMIEFKPIVLKSIDDFVCGSIPGRGCITGKKALEKWIKLYGNKRFYVFKADIKKFYDSIDHDRLMFKLQHIINDQRYLDLIKQLLDTYEPGLPKGVYCSQWFSNYFMQEFDTFIRQELEVDHYIRYMDDIVILCPNKRKLHRIKDRIEKYLNTNLGLKLKENWQIFRFVDKNDENGRDIDFLGFRFYRNKTTLRKSILRRARRKALHLDKKVKAGKKITGYDARSMMCYLEFLRKSDTYNYFLKYIKPYVNRRRLRQIISSSDRYKAHLKKVEQEQIVSEFIENEISKT